MRYIILVTDMKSATSGSRLYPSIGLNEEM